MDFAERLKQAAEHAGVRPAQTEIARSLGLNRQTVFQWFHGTMPESAMIARIALAWRVDPTWLATGAGEKVMRPAASGLSSEERDIIRFYRNARPTRRKALYDMAKALGKSVVVAALAIPPLLPSEAEAVILSLRTQAVYYVKLLFRTLLAIPDLRLAALHSQ